MRKLLLKLFVFVLLLQINEHVQAQSRFSHELGGFFGIASLQTDFGISGEFAAANQSSLAFGVTHYLKFFGSQYNWRSGSSYFSEHFKLKSQFYYINNTNITHEGIPPSSANFEKLQAMKGSAKLYSVGTNLEYYFLELEDYSSFYRASGTINPFLNVGIHWSYSQPDITVDGQSLKGQSEPYTDLIDKWQVGAVHLQDDQFFSASAGAGVRFGLDKVDIVLEGRYQYFFSDRVEGLDAPDDPANKSNDSMVLLNLGVVYVFGKY